MAPFPPDTRIYSETEITTLISQQRDVTDALHRGEFRNRDLSLRLLCDLHSAIFRGVRDHGGKVRNLHFGQEVLGFGLNSSVHRSQVERQLEVVFRDIERIVASFDDNLEDDDYEEKAVQAAAWAHAEIVRIHPFEDGTGRSARLFLNCMLMRLGLRPISVEVPKEEYNNCLNAWHTARDLAPLTDLLIRLLNTSVPLKRTSRAGEESPDVPNA